jgi:prostaglandin-H2 D-isomerase / glutathione transferase
MSTYKLYYFNARGRAEISRLIFAAAGEKYEDIRYEQDEWPSHKAEMPLGQMPTLEIDGTKLPQSMSIARFLAKQFGLAGRDYLEQAKVDAVVDTSIDLAMKYLLVYFEKDEEKKLIETKRFFTEELPKHLRNLEALAKLYSNGGPFFMGNHLTWCDLEVYDMLDILLRIDDKFLDSYTWLLNNRHEIARCPLIAAYLKSRPASSR